FSQEDVEHDLDQSPPSKNQLGYFALLRYDQLDEYGDLIKSAGLTKEAAKEVLGGMRARMEHGDNAYKRFREQQTRETRDHRARRLVWAKATQLQLVDGLEGFQTDSEGTFIRIVGFEHRPPDCLSTGSDELTPNDVLRYEHHDGS